MKTLIKVKYDRENTTIKWERSKNCYVEAVIGNYGAIRYTANFTNEILFGEDNLYNTQHFPDLVKQLEDI